jgi:hypothetical protein
VLFVREKSLPLIQGARSSLAVDISRGVGGQRTSKRGAVSLEFGLKGGRTLIRIVNLHIDWKDRNSRFKDLA